MKLQEKILWFVAESTFDIFLPTVALPWTIGSRFYRNFLAFDPQAKLEFLAEGGQLTDADINRLIDALTANWKPSLPNGTLTAQQRDLVRMLLLAPREARATGIEPDEAIRQALNRMLLSGQSQQIAPITLQPEQRAVARSVLRSVMTGHAMAHQPRQPFRPLPPNAPSLPGYTLQSILGDGGFSTVYLARHDASNEMRAIKIGTLDDPRRFEREVQLLQSLGGAHIVRYFEHGQIQNQFWIAMEYLGHRTLADLIAAKVEPDTALLLGEQILRGLSALHEKGIIHRDLKPENVMVDDQFRMKLIDFGLAKPIHGTGAQSVSMTAGLIGTPRYMSPEQIRDSRAVAPATDVWSFGCMLYEMLTAQPLFASDNIMALGHEIMTKELRVDRPEIPMEIRALLDRCLQREIQPRIADARALLQSYQPAAEEARRRLRHERYRERWVYVLEKKLLEQFVAQHKGQLPASAPRLFQEYAMGNGSAELDETRLSEILPPIFAKHAEANQVAVAALLQSLGTTVHEQLATEVNVWQQLKAQEHQQREARRKQEEAAEAQRKQKAEEERRRQAEENARLAQQRDIANEKLRARRKVVLRSVLYGLFGGLSWIVVGLISRQPTGVNWYDLAVIVAIVLVVPGMLIGGIVGARRGYDRYQMSADGWAGGLSGVAIGSLAATLLGGIIGGIWGATVIDKPPPVLGIWALCGLPLGILSGTLLFPVAIIGRDGKSAVIYYWIMGVLMSIVIGTATSLTSTLVHPVLGLCVSSLATALLFPFILRHGDWISTQIDMFFFDRD